MHVVVDLCVVPFTAEGSVAPYVAACQRILKEAGLIHTLHANGTGIEGEWGPVFAAIERCHAAVHAMGAERIFSTLRVGTRTDAQSSLEGKLARARAAMGDADSEEAP